MIKFVLKLNKMKLSDLNLEQKYTYADYMKWTFDEAVELIKGRIFKMAAPLSNHQTSSTNFTYLFKTHLKGSRCRVYAAPFDVRLPKPLSQRKSDTDIETVVQPDICVVCDLSKIDRRGCVGAPDLIVEILSKGTVGKDVKDKYEVYEESGVREYWIVNITEKMVNVFRLNEQGKYVPDTRPYIPTESIRVGIFNDFSILVDDIFEGLMDFDD
jgi:Uma2 family endonuclease